MRRKYHEQFVQPRFVDLFAHVPSRRSHPHELLLVAAGGMA
jgi:hypothetical protein